VIAIPAVGISRFPRRAIDALGVVAWTGDYLPGHCGHCRQGKSCGSAENTEFHHAFLDFIAVRRETGVSIEVSIFIPRSGSNNGDCSVDAEFDRSRSIA